MTDLLPRWLIRVLILASGGLCGWVFFVLMDRWGRHNNAPFLAVLAMIADMAVVICLPVIFVCAWDTGYVSAGSRRRASRRRDWQHARRRQWQKRRQRWREYRERREAGVVLGSRCRQCGGFVPPPSGRYLQYCGLHGYDYRPETHAEAMARAMQSSEERVDALWREIEEYDRLVAERELERSARHEGSVCTS